MYLDEGSSFTSTTNRRKLTRHLYVFVILIIWMELCGELGVQLSGHSKWKTIKHTKEANDAKRSGIFSKLSQAIINFAMKGSSNPKSNADLAKAIAAAQKASMPAATIKRALERVELRKKNPTASFFAFKGPHGVYILVSVQTDNVQRTKLDLQRIFVKRHRFTMAFGNPHSPFTTQGWIIAKPPENTTNVVEQGLEDAIETGADEVEPDEDDPENLKFVCESSKLHKVKTALEGRNYDIQDAYEMYIARMPVEIAENQMHSIKALVEEVEDLSEVDKVYTNIACATLKNRYPSVAVDETKKGRLVHPCGRRKSSDHHYYKVRIALFGAGMSGWWLNSLRAAKKEHGYGEHD